MAPLKEAEQKPPERKEPAGEKGLAEPGLRVPAADFLFYAFQDVHGKGKEHPEKGPHTKRFQNTRFQ